MAKYASDIYIYTQGHYIEQDGLKGAGYSFTILSDATSHDRSGPSVSSHLVAEYEAVGQALETCKEVLERKMAAWTRQHPRSLMIHVCPSHPDVARVGGNEVQPQDPYGEKFVHMLNNFRCGLSLSPEENPVVRLSFAPFQENPFERQAVAARAREAAQAALTQNLRCDRINSALDSLETTGVIPASAIAYFRGPYVKHSVVEVLRGRRDAAAQALVAKVQVDSSFLNFPALADKPIVPLYNPFQSRRLVPKFV